MLAWTGGKRRRLTAQPLDYMPSCLALDSCQQVLQLVGDGCGLGALTTAANRMGELCRGMPAGAKRAANQAAFRDLVAIAFKDLSSFDACACAQYLWAAAHMQQRTRKIK